MLGLISAACYIRDTLRFSGQLSIPAAGIEINPHHLVHRILVLLICVTKVAKSAFDKALAEHEDIDDVVGSEEPTECDHGVDLQQSLLIKIDSFDGHKNETYS
ncbi:hypothetical protein OROGR_014566 [Orobanche gracilis]